METDPATSSRWLRCVTEICAETGRKKGRHALKGKRGDSHVVRRLGLNLRLDGVDGRGRRHGQEGARSVQVVGAAVVAAVGQKVGAGGHGGRVVRRQLSADGQQRCRAAQELSGRLFEAAVQHQEQGGVDERVGEADVEHHLVRGRIFGRPHRRQRPALAAGAAAAEDDHREERPPEQAVHDAHGGEHADAPDALGLQSLHQLVHRALVLFGSRLAQDGRHQSTIQTATHSTLFSSDTSRSRLLGRDVVDLPTADALCIVSSSVSVSNQRLNNSQTRNRLPLSK